MFDEASCASADGNRILASCYLRSATECTPDSVFTGPHLWTVCIRLHNHGMIDEQLDATTKKRKCYNEDKRCTLTSRQRPISTVFYYGTKYVFRPPSHHRAMPAHYPSLPHRARQLMTLSHSEPPSHAEPLLQPVCLELGTQGFASIPKRSLC